MAAEESNADSRRLSILALGQQGDGLAREAAGRAVFVPLALPGEDIEIAADGALARVVTPSADRVTPPCPHFAACGGCVAQHMADALYVRWKRDILLAALAERGLGDIAVGDLVRTAPGARRRAVLTARRDNGSIALGYHARRSHDLVDIATCLVLDPAIVRALPGLKRLVAVLGVAEARLTALATSSGLDVAIAAELKRLSPHIAQEQAKVAAEHRFARVSLNGEPVVSRTKPVLNIAGVSVSPPPGGFVQAVESAEDALRTRVLAAVGEAKSVADLFCGLGAFTFALSRKARVMAADSDRQALAALAEARRHAQGLKPIEHLARDLFRDPLGPKELESFDAVVLDPPRAGGQAQAEALARSDVPVVAYVSCSPTTFARDARILVDGGYRLEDVTPVDQFLYSDHLEVVGVFRKPRRKRR